MGFMSSLVFGFCTGLSFVGWISWLQKKRSEVRMVKATDIAALSRMDREDLKKLISAELMPSWCKFQTFEKVEWINQELREIWPFVSKAASELIRSIVQPILNSAKPAVLSKLEFEKFSLGTLAPQLGGINYVDTPDDEVVMEIDLKWGGNPSIILNVQPLGSPIGIEVQVKDLMFFANIKLMFKPLVDDLPCFGAIVVSLTEKPSLNFVLKFGGGEVTAISFLDATLDRLIRDIIEAQLVWPARIVVPIKPGDYEDLQMKDVGVLDVKLVEAIELENTDFIGTSDPYAKLYVRPIYAQEFRSKTKNNQLNPVWNEGFAIKVQDPSTQKLMIRIFDEEVGKSDEYIGEARLPLSGLMKKPGNFEDMWLTLYKNCENPREGKPKGKVHLEVVYRPFGPDGLPIAPPLIAQNVSVHEVNKMTELETLIASVSTEELSNGTASTERRLFDRGVLFIKVIKASNLLAADIATGTSDPFVMLWMQNGNGSKQRTQVIYKELDPVWEEEFEFLVENPHDDMLRLEVYDHDMFGRKARAKRGEVNGNGNCCATGDLSKTWCMGYPTIADGGGHKLEVAEDQRRWMGITEAGYGVWDSDGCSNGKPSNTSCMGYPAIVDRGHKLEVGEDRSGFPEAGFGDGDLNGCGDGEMRISWGMRYLPTVVESGGCKIKGVEERGRWTDVAEVLLRLVFMLLVLGAPIVGVEGFQQIGGGLSSQPLGGQQPIALFNGSVRGNSSDGEIPIYVGVGLSRIVDIDEVNHRFELLFQMRLAWQHSGMTLEAHAMVATSSIVSQNISALQQECFDSRVNLAHNATSQRVCTDAATRRMECTKYCSSYDRAACCDNIWLPGLAFTNLISLPQERLTSDVIVIPGSSSTNSTISSSVWGLRLTDIHGVFASPLSFGRFPFDTQELRLEIATEYGGYYIEKSTLFEGKWTYAKSGTNESLEKSSVEGTADHAKWKLVNMTWDCEKGGTDRRAFYDERTSNGPAFLSELVNTGETSEKSPKNCVLKIHIKRRTSFYIWRMILPVFIVVTLSFVSLWASPCDLNVRLLVTVLLFLALVTLQLSASLSLPTSASLTTYDSFLLLSYFMIVVVIIEHVMVYYICTRDEKRELRFQSRKSSGGSRIARGGCSGGGGGGEGQGGERTPVVPELPIGMQEHLLKPAPGIFDTEDSISRHPGGQLGRQASFVLNIRKRVRRSPAFRRRYQAKQLQLGKRRNMVHLTAMIIDRVCLCILPVFYYMLAVLILRMQMA